MDLSNKCNLFSPHWAHCFQTPSFPKGAVILAKQFRWLKGVAREIEYSAWYIDFALESKYASSIFIPLSRSCKHKNRDPATYLAHPSSNIKWASLIAWCHSFVSLSVSPSFQPSGILVLKFREKQLRQGFLIGVYKEGIDWISVHGDSVHDKTRKDRDAL